MDTKEENKDDTKSPAAAEGSSPKPNETSTAESNSSTGNTNNFPNASMMGGMNPMAMMQYQGGMGMGGGGGTQDMMSMMGGGYCGPTGAFGYNPQLMAQMMGSTTTKRSYGDAVDGSGEPSAKRAKDENDGSEKDGSDSKDKEVSQDGGGDDEKDNVPPKVIPNVPASTEGVKFYSRNDVLCGRGGGTNVHPGNRRFRDLINANRRAYLKARKNDKPAISRSIVRTIREMNGRFLKKDEKQGLWFEIGDDCAREKTSQALRQRAPEMRKILFDDEQRQVAMQQHEMMMQRAAMMSGASGQDGQMQMNPMMMGMGMGGYGQMNPSMMAMGGGMNPSMGSASQGGGGGGPQDSDLMAKYNQLHQKNWLAQEKNMILQRLAMSGGMNPQGGMNMPNNMMKDGNSPGSSQQQPMDSSMSPRAA